MSKQNSLLKPIVRKTALSTNLYFGNVNKHITAIQNLLVYFIMLVYDSNIILAKKKNHQLLTSQIKMITNCILNHSTPLFKAVAIAHKMRMGAVSADF